MTISGAGSPAPDEGQAGQPVVTPDEGQVTDWEARARELEEQYGNLRPEFTRTTQRLSEYEQLFEALQDPERQAETLAQFGLELDTGPADTGAPDDEFVDPLEKEVAELREWKANLESERELEAKTAQEAQLLEARDEYVDEAIEFIEKQPNIPKFSNKEKEVLGNLAIAMTGEDGVPDVQGAYNALYGEESVLEAARSRWIDSKTGAIQAPRGAAVSSETRPTNRRERVAYMDERVAALEAQQ